ncbi:sema domain-containing protein [Ditylenchus destructor]|uniref:Sema domain-containing protein n=1 Tax=Ditylenchus destructor TaxID=166010 RepID=A0AAD4RDA1_9BILA|nr:sema domain-containing protein [Ditylenchus destructor]
MNSVTTGIRFAIRRRTVLKLALLFLFTQILLCKLTDAEPSVFNLRSKSYDTDGDDRDQFAVFSRSDYIKEYGNPNATEYFRLLEMDGDHLIIGAADAVHNISVESFENVSLYGWQPGELEREDCIMKSVDQTACRNYIRVLNRRHNGDLLLCGTNAYRPMCRVVDRHTHRVISEFSGTGLSPLDPKHNTTFYMDRDYLYAATVADFSGTDALIFRRNISAAEDRGLRTQRNNALVLNKPQFVGTLHTDEYVYFFFREEATEVLDATSTYSRVARKRTNHFTLTRYSYRRYHVRHSVICAFDLEQIDRLFEHSDHLALDLERRKWVKQRREGPTSKIGQCQPNSRLLSEDDAITMRKFPLLSDAVPNIFSQTGAVGIHRGSDHYNQIVVLQNVEFHEGVADVLYVATDQGNIVKMVNLVGFNPQPGRKARQIVDFGDDPMVPVALPIRRLLISKNKYLIVVTDPVVYRLPLHMCSAHQSCDECIGSRDPHCVWHDFKCVHLRNVQKKFAYQDVLLRRPGICAEIEAKEGKRKEALASKSTATAIPVISSSLDAMGSLNASNSIANLVLEKTCDCLDPKCNCSLIKTPVFESQPILELTTMHSSNTTVGLSPIQASEFQNTSRLPWWVLIIIALAIIQTLSLFYICCRIYTKRRNNSKLEKSGKCVTMPKTNGLLSKSICTNGSLGSSLTHSGELISAYSPAMILPSKLVGEKQHVPLNYSTLNRSQMMSSNSSLPPNSTQWAWINNSSKQSSDVRQYNEMDRPRPGAFFAGFLAPFRTRPSEYGDGEINIQLEGSAAPSMALSNARSHHNGPLYRA